MAARKTPRLAYCEYVSPETDNSKQVWQARCQLIEAAKRVYPKFLETLSAKIFPIYYNLANTGYDFERILFVPQDMSPYDLLPTDCGLKSALFKWATEFHSEAAAWIMDGALLTLHFWYVGPEKRESLTWCEMHASSVTPSAGEPFRFNCEGWETELLTWPTYRKSVRVRVEKELRDYERHTRQLAGSCGLVRARRKYSPHNFDWFVLYQFAGQSCTKIARRWAQKNEPVDDSTVLKGIKAAAKLVGWELLRGRQLTRAEPENSTTA